MKMKNYVKMPEIGPNESSLKVLNTLCFDNQFCPIISSNIALIFNNI